MTHKKTVDIVRRFLKKTQAWLDRTTGVLNVSMDVGTQNIVLAKRRDISKLNNKTA